MRNDLAELWRYRELLLALVERDLRIRYKNSVFGALWSLLNPLITVAVMTVVFKFFFRYEMANYSAYILAAYLPYMFFSQAVLDSSQSVLQAMPIVKKVYFPREILPLVSIISNFVHLLLALVVFFLFLGAVYLSDPRITPFSWNMLLLPIPLALNLMLAVGIGLIISALHTFFEDVKYIVQFLMQLLLFLSPIMYFTEQVVAFSEKPGNAWVYWLYHANPVASLSVIYRKVLVAPQDVVVGTEKLAWLPLDWRLVALTAFLSLGILVGGYAMFCRMKWRFVERP